MQFERVELKLKKATNADEITRLFERNGELRVKYDELRQDMEDGLVKEIEKIQKFLDENTSVRKFEISDIKKAFDISLKMVVVKTALERLLSNGKCDLKKIIDTNVRVFKEGFTKHATIEAFILLLREEICDHSASYPSVKEAISILENLKK